MRGPVNSAITLTISRKDRTPFDVKLTRAIIKVPSVNSRLIGKDIGYIRIASFTEQTDVGLNNAMAKLKDDSGSKLAGLVLDLRNNPGGLLDQAVAVASAFIDKGEIVSTRGRNPDDAQRYDSHTADITGGLPMAVLINGGSASASEIVAGALQDHHRAIIIGTRSFGKGSVQTIIPLGSHGAMRLTTARYYTPSGRSIQGLGIEPDVHVTESREEQPHFGPEHESDLNGTIKNQGGTGQKSIAPRTDLPPIVKEIPDKPPVGYAKFDPAKPDTTDFQLQEAIVLAKALASQKAVSSN
jgi:carboxyl-terminal processing protease